MRFQILNKLFFRSDSKSSRVSLSTPGAPLLAATRLYASHTCCLGISNGLTCDVGMFPLFLLGNAPVDRIDSPDEPVPWLRSHLQTAGVSQLLRAGPPANAASVLSAFGFCLGTLPLATGGSLDPVNGRRYRRSPSHVPCKSSRPGSRRLYAGPPLANTRAPARLIPRGDTGPSVSMPINFYDASTATPNRVAPGRPLLARLPSPHLTHLVRLFPDAHHDGLQPTQLRVV